ncbi:hypothetical protein SVIOM342S_08511 [Streptomyces violaceorubidus]
MPDRSLRLLTLPQQSAQPGERSTVLLRERPSSPPDTPSDRRGGGGQDGSTDQDNPFAPPPEGTPDRPWQPRHPSGDDDSQGEGGRSPWAASGATGSPAGPPAASASGPAVRAAPRGRAADRARAGTRRTPPSGVPATPC